VRGLCRFGYHTEMAGPYRRRHREVDVEAIEAASPSLHTIEVSGAHGAHGAHGSDGSNGVGAGGNGQGGSNAGAAYRGADAGSIHVIMATGSADGVFTLSGSQVHSAGQQEPIKATLTVGSKGTVDLLSRGGRGGTGGNGGDGGAGARGSHGRDATRHSSGTDGGDGGNGGRGGNATSGAAGGSGGSVVVEVDEYDTQLLMLARRSISGGRGGAAGRNGSGGRGGSGGSGGSSYSWTESDTYTDSEGNQQSTTTFHSNSGGSDGSSGRAGGSGSAVVHRGSTGAEGRYEIHVTTESGVEKYDSCYDIALESFSHESLNADSVYEPGERIRVENFVGRNVGGMPTPKHRDITTRLVREGWVYPDEGEQLLLPRGIKAGETFSHSDPLHFTIGDFVPKGPSDPLEQEETLELRATLPAVSRDFTRYETEDSTACGQFVIRFPVRVSKIESLHSLAPGQRCRMRWTVVNQSTGDLGRESSSGRVLGVRLYLEGSELGPENLRFVNDEGATHSLAEPFVRHIPLLRAGESQSIEVELGFHGDAEHYLSCTLRLALDLGYLDKPKLGRAIQFREFTTRVARPYLQIDSATLLLVVNQGTTRAEFDAWSAVATDVGLILNTWDLSFGGHLDLEAPIAGTGLCEQFAGKTMVVLDNEIETSSGMLRPHDLLDKRQFFRAVDKDINVAFLGVDYDLDKLLVRTDCELHEWADSPKTLLAALEDSRDVHGDVLRGFDCSLTVYGRKWWWQRPKLAELQERALDFQVELANEHPDRRYIVIYDFSPAKESADLLRKRWKLGTFSVVPSLDSAAGTVVHSQIDEDVLHTADFVESDHNITALLLTKNLDEKLVRLDDLLYRHGVPTLLGLIDDDVPEDKRIVMDLKTDHVVTLLVDAICADLANEITAVLSSLWRSGLSAEQMHRSMPLFAKLAAFRFTGGSAHPPGSPGGNHLVRLIARVVFCARSQAQWWEWLPPFYFSRRSIGLRGQVKRFLEEFAEHTFGEAIKEANHHIAAAVKNEKATHRSAKRAGEGHRKRWRYARGLLRQPLLSNQITTDAEVLADPMSRLLTRKQYDALKADDRANQERRMAMVAANAEAREKLLIADSD